jgi:tetratricopeptide (TPR) repeat protein
LHFELAKLLLQRGQLREAVSEFQESIRNGYKDEDQFIAVAKARKLLDHRGYHSLVSDNFGDSAAKIVQEHWEKIRLQVLQEDRQKFEKLAMEARDFVRNQKLNEAIQLAQTGAAEFPNLEDSKSLLEEIQTYVRRAECNSLVNTAQELIKQNHFIEAQDNLSRALDLIPNYPDAVKLQEELPTLKLKRKNDLLNSTRLIYRKQTQKAAENLKEVENLFPGDDQVHTLREEINGFLAKVAELKKRAETAAVGRPDLGVLEAITELRGLIPEDNEVIAVWQRFCVLTNSLGMRLIFIPSTQKLSSLAIVKRGFFLAELETTEAQWANIMPHSLSNLLYRDFSEKKWRQDGTYYHEAQDHPVCQVSLVDALAFVDKLNQREKRLYRLPNPEEWEYACLAGRTITRLTADSLDSVAWFHGNAAKKGETYPHRIGQKSPNDWGLYDMLGNIAEWCASENINTLNKNQLGVVKGGSWDDLAEKITPDHQFVNIFQKARTIGFRVALDLP